MGVGDFSRKFIPPMNERMNKSILNFNIMLLFIRLTNIALDPAFIFIWAGAVTFIIGFTGIQVYFLGVQNTDIQVIYLVYRYAGLLLG